jgi:hypothetical protein
VTKLVDYTSEEVVAQAYFDGLLAYLRRDFNNAYGAKTGWSTFAHKCSDDDWRGARRVMDTKAQVIPPKTALPKADFSKGGLPALY